VSRKLHAHLLLTLVALIWGATFVVIKGALSNVSPLLFNAIRMTAATFCLAALYPREVTGLKSKAFLFSLPVGLFLFAGYALQTTGLRLTTPSKSAFITGLSVVLVPLFMFAFFRRRLSMWSATGVLASFIGLATLALPAGQAWSDFSRVNPGDWLTLGCAISFALHIIMLGRATERVSFKAVAILQTGVAAVLMWLSVPIFEQPHILWSRVVIVALIITAVFATAFAFGVQSWAQQFTPPTHTALIFTLEPVFAAATSYLVLGERLGGRSLLGCGLILSGVLLSELMPLISTRPA
jgi:drug/metabolite transporter (DMT)-like permease